MLVGEGNEMFLRRVWKLLPSRCVLKSIFASGGRWLLQMVSEPGSGRCVGEDASPQGGVDCEIPHRLERETKYSL